MFRTLFVIMGILTWLIIFFIGTQVNATAEAAKLRESGSPIIALGLMFVAWTWTNLAILCCVASFVGGLARPAGNGIDTVTIASVIGAGFMVFLSLFGGQFAVNGSIDVVPSGIVAKPNVEDASPDVVLSNLRQDRYIRLAFVGSFLGVLIGVEPGTMNLMFNKLRRRQAGIVGSDSNAP